jgi:hypothetical protein
MATTSTDERSRRDEPLSALVRSLIADVSLLVRGEIELAKLEAKDAASKRGAAAGLMAGGVVVALYALATLIVAAVLGLAIVLPAWAAAVIVGVALVLIALILVLIGRARMRAAGPITPTRTIEGAKEDVAWIRRQTEHLKTLD